MINSPRATPGQVIGLLGGSFDPPHAGHLHISRMALKRLSLSGVWWLISPGNPLKAHAPSQRAQRMANTRKIIDHPRIIPSDIEYRLGTRHTVDTLRKLRERYPGVAFIWLMGADNLGAFHRWKNWDLIMQETPVAVFARPREKRRALASKAAIKYQSDRIRDHEARRLAHIRPPVWSFLGGPEIDISSAALRAK